MLLAKLFEIAEKDKVLRSEANVQISNGPTPFIGDLCCLYDYEHESNPAWYTSTIIDAVLKLEERHVHDVYVEKTLDIWFLSFARHIDVLNQIITEAAPSQQKVPFLNWSFADLDPHAGHSRILTVVNPSSAHWVAVEIDLVADPPMLTIFNSLTQMNAKGGMYRDIVNMFPRLLRIASLRPVSPLAHVNLDELTIREYPVPQQENQRDLDFLLFASSSPDFEAWSWTSFIFPVLIE